MNRQATGETRAFCGCGLSKTFPFCDSSQKISRSREPAKLVSCGPARPEEQSKAKAEAVEA
jgi:CDGSH-type Zn-finger protein